MFFIIYPEIELGKLDERLVQILAWQRLQQLLPPKPGNAPAPANSPSISTTSTSLATNLTTAAMTTQHTSTVTSSVKKPGTSATIQPTHTGEKLNYMFYHGVREEGGGVNKIQ